MDDFNNSLMEAARLEDQIKNTPASKSPADQELKTRRMVEVADIRQCVYWKKIEAFPVEPSKMPPNPTRKEFRYLQTMVYNNAVGLVKSGIFIRRAQQLVTASQGFILLASTEPSMFGPEFGLNHNIGVALDELTTIDASKSLGVLKKFYSLCHQFASNHEKMTYMSNWIEAENARIKRNLRRRPAIAAAPAELVHGNTPA